MQAPRLWEPVPSEHCTQQGWAGWICLFLPTLGHPVSTDLRLLEVTDGIRDHPKPLQSLGRKQERGSVSPVAPAPRNS